ncbi:RNA polymerase II transcription elongation factor Rtf1p, putative [Cordyceps militaris CM01]|uniref:RNA polymerase II transcription elongation factor Rtf1p, putative n=1 Tax=Cordyceps militaris (strain CM01) TaxID=983644 RepID=G3J4J8_CORMM|nr:RNA polymerase II transcription elongation factor Rtf1p, putative [Cordyceps militaris CM01]EGX95868.1 RNA polymerase II transcription elongation factor Rtf1p, putative [Cordyceps militaris CM01]
MADFEADLFDLAGGDSDSEGSVVDRRRSASPPAKRGASKAKTSRHDADADSEEEGEAHSGPGSPNSLDSAPMDESDSDDEQPKPRGPEPGGAGTDEEKYPVDGKFRSESEKAEIRAMPELEREQILADRANEIERLRQNRLLRQMVTETQNDERKAKKKRSADSADLDDDEDEDRHGKASRRAATATGGTAMDALRRARADRQKRREDHERRRDVYSPRRGDSDGEASEDDYRRGGGSRTPEKKDEKKDEPKPELRDYERVCFTPGFEPAITGCFIRIALGPHPDTGIEQYRMAIIKGFTTGRAYALSGPNGTFVTDQYVKAAHGKAVKEFPFIAASSGKFTENEMNRYQVTCHNENVKTPIKTVLNSKIDQINNLLTHNWTNEEIKARVARRNELRKRFDPAERARVARLLEEATVGGDDDRMQELQEELDKLGSQRLAFKTSLGPAKSSAYDSNGGAITKMSTEQDRLAARNKENRRMNQEGVRKAQLREKARMRENELSLSRGEMVKEDPSRRLRTKAKFVHDVNETVAGADGGGSKAASGVSTPATANGTPTVAPIKPGALLPHLAKLQDRSQADSKGLPMIHKPLMDDDVIGSLDLDIDIDI